MKIGVVGIGAMGAPMARNLAQGGDSVLAFDVAPEKVNAIAGNGVERAGTLADIARECELIVLMTPGGETA
ncbi:MAG: NAD(P)-binding domain-containing protein [Alphaproteobacteria bacterium]|nr:NAD(P)-binding domain-containing protein [Alphaproteobacteria bacterium]